MAKYMVTGAMVQTRGTARDGSTAIVYAYRGAVVDLDAQAAEHLTSVGLVEKLADVDTDPVVAAGPAAAAAAVVDAPVRPADDADKAAWEAYAIRSGLAASDAEAASQEDLVAIFGGDGLVPTEEPVETTEVVRPNNGASKADWVKYAVSRDVPEEEAEKLTRDQLASDPRLTAPTA